MCIYEVAVWLSISDPCLSKIRNKYKAKATISCFNDSHSNLQGSKHRESQS